MPYSELHRMSKGKLGSTTQTKMTSCPADANFAPDNEFVELVWENGQVMVQGQASKTRKSATGAGFSSLTSKTQEKDRGDVGMSKIARFGMMDSVLNDFSPSGPSGHIGLVQDDEMVPWLNYPFDDHLPHDYCSEFMNELTGANLNSLSAHTNPVPVGKDTGYSQVVRDSHMVSLQGGAKPEQRNASKVVGGGGGLDSSKPVSDWLCSLMLHQNQSSVPSLRSSVSDFDHSNTTTTNTHQASCHKSTVTPVSTGSLPNTMIQKQDPGPTRPTGQLNSTGLMNFSHFSRSAALSKPNVQSSHAVATPDRFRSNEKMCSVISSNPMESAVIDSTSGSPSVVGFKSQPVLMSGKMDLRPSAGKPAKEHLTTEHSEAICGENVFKNTRPADQALGRTSSFAASAAAIGRPENEKEAEPMVGSSSMCSGSSAGGASNEPKDVPKRKYRDVDESECQSEDVEEESVGARKPATARGGTGAKRSRAAEVHNLSERRRRDRINEKMRALQELIPNCNKVDKASMLDEAIEYLKTLQLQVQIMSMGAGMYMPPMMLPTGMHQPHFSPMSVGMGMGMGMGMGVGFGMGMVDMSGRPLVMSPMHGMQFPHSPISGTSSLPMMSGSSHPMLGIPSQGHPMSMSIPRAPYAPLSEGPSTRPVSLPDISGATTLQEGPNAAIPSSSKGQLQNTNLQVMAKTGGECSQNQTATQAPKEGFEQPATLQRNDQAPNTSGKENANSANGTLNRPPTGYN